jgi:phosphoglycerate kinase
MAKLSVKDLDVKGKKVFVRVDFNVPLDEGSHVTDDTRIRAALPTISYILEQGGIPVLVSHLGRPKGSYDPKLSLKPVAERLVKLLDRKVVFAPDCVGEEVKRLSDSLKPGDIMLLENTRFHPEEKSNDPEFAKQMASLADLYVNDAFGTAHRAHASVVGVAANFDNPACGLLMEQEITFFGNVLKDPKRPLMAIIGGAKVSTKIGVIKNLLRVVDRLIIGGGMCYTFYKAQGYQIGTSLCEPDFVSTAKELLDSEKIYLPVDVVTAPEVKVGAAIQTVDAHEMPADRAGVDIGERSRQDITAEIEKAQTIVWNGPLGIFEIEDFSRGTQAIAQAVVHATERGAVSIVGGGDTIAALRKFRMVDKVSHASTGGGASLEFLEGKELPGVTILKDI